MGRLGINIVMIHRRAPPVEVLRERRASEMRLDSAPVIPTGMKYRSPKRPSAGVKRKACESIGPVTRSIPLQMAAG
jgi:hypothetical protein